MVTRSVNEDVAYTASTSPLEWKVTYSGETVVEGVSVMRPDQTSVSIYPNRLVEDLLESTFPTATGVTQDEGACKVFTLETSGGTTLEQYTFINSSTPVSGTTFLSEPVNGHADPRQWLYLTRCSATAGNINVTDD